MPLDASPPPTDGTGVSSPPLRLRLLGPARLISTDGTSLDSILSSPKRLALLGYLAVEGQRGMCSRDRVLGIFWPDSTTEAGRNSLRQALFHLRKSLGEGVIVTQGDDRLRLDPDRFACDVAAFERAVEQGRPEAALELYDGDFLEGFFLSEAREFDEWLATERTRLRDLAAAAAWQASEDAESSGSLARAAEWARRAVAFHPENEAAVRRLMGLLDRAGNRSGAVQAYEEFARWLSAELDLEPAPETQELVAEIRVRPDAVEVEKEPGPPESSPGRSDATPTSGARGRVGRARALGYMGAGFSMAAGAYLVVSGLSGDSRMHIAVLPLVVEEPRDTALQALADGITQALTDMVSRLQTERDSMWVVPASDVARAGIATSADARRIFNVDAVLTGTLSRRDSVVELELDLIDPQAPRVVRSLTVPGPLDPEFPIATDRALRDLLGVGRPGVSDWALAEGEAIEPGARHLYLQGIGYLRRYDVGSNLEHSVSLLDDAIRQQPDFAAAHAGLCQAKWEQYRRTGSRLLAGEAVASCDRAAEISGDQPEVLLALGRGYLAQGDHRKARTSLERAFDLAPTNADVSRWLGRVLEEQGDIEGAERAHRRSIALQPGAWVYYLELGQLLAYSSRHDEALEHFESARRLSPDNHLVYLGLGYSRMRLNQTDEARSLFELAIQKQPNAGAYHNLGYLHLRDLAFPRAAAVLEAGLTLDPASYSILRLLGHARHWSGDEAGAREAWHRAIEPALRELAVNPRDPVALMTLAEILVLLGRVDEGRRVLDRMLALERQFTFHVYEIARVYELLGDRRAALNHLGRALARGFDPTFVARDPWLADLRADPGYPIPEPLIEGRPSQEDTGNA